jgi:fructuronate reductase
VSPAAQIPSRQAEGPDVARLGYDLASVSIGVAHIGLGAFHRAHQAHYFNRMLARDPSWGVSATSMHSGQVAAGLRTQNGLYTLALLDDAPRFDLIGAIRECCPPRDPGFVARLSNPATRVITLTVTEKGYCLSPSGALDEEHPCICRDLESPATPSTAIGLLVSALGARRRDGAGGVEILSCDNLSANGDKLRGAVLTFASQMDVDLAKWIEDSVRFPNAMVDAITPASDSALVSSVTRATGWADAWPVQRERFSSWIIERAASARFLDLESVGVVVTTDVAAHERAKLRMLNGAHSTLAYLGLACGLETVAQAMARPDLARFIAAMMHEEIAPGLVGAQGLDIEAYRASLLRRFANPAIAHRLSQIAWDGSQKLPIRLLGAVQDNITAGRSIARLCCGVAAWMRFVARAAKAGGEITDPMKDRLVAIGRGLSDEAATDVRAFLAVEAIFPRALADAPEFQRELRRGYEWLVRIETLGGAFDEALSTNAHAGREQV